MFLRQCRLLEGRFFFKIFSKFPDWLILQLNNFFILCEDRKIANFPVAHNVNKNLT